VCGLVGTVGGSRARVELGLDALAHRGPDGRGVVEAGPAVLGHVRLAVIDPTDASAQPFADGGVVVAYNGELWNHRELRAVLPGPWRTAGDTEVVARCLDVHGPAGLELMDGMWAVAWVDAAGRCRLARDRFGEVPLHVGRAGDGWWWASEQKALARLGCRWWRDVGPGELVELGPHGLVEDRWYDPPAEPADVGPEEAGGLVAGLLEAGTVARGLAADVPACTLLSGGIDSAAVALHLAATLPDLVAYTAVLDRRSRDLRCARSTAEHLGVKLVEVAVEPPTADDLARVVAEVELPHKAQVEIGWACLALAEAMRGDGFKVTYSGEGSDELWASYGMSWHGVAREGWHAHRKRLVLDQARKNFVRCNKVFMARSVEVRLPFLHRPLVEAALSFPQASVAERGRPKAVLQRALRGRLPAEVVDRPKVAFQDGMGLKAACAAAVADPTRFYRAEYRRLYGRGL
jgi:asparagine synthase (glutamine-hydrolysing)